MNGNGTGEQLGRILHELGWSGWGDPFSVALMASYVIVLALLVALLARATRKVLRRAVTARRRRQDVTLTRIAASPQRQARPPQHARLDRWSGEWLLIGVAIVVAIAVAGLGGVRSFEAVSQRFNSPLVPLLADGMIIACTALRLAAMSRGWRLPGSLVTTYVFISGTVWLNAASARGWNDVIAHALAPVAYAALVEMLAQMLRLHLGLVEPSTRRRGAGGVAGLRRLGWLMWVTSPIVTTRVGLHLARTGGDDPIAARALVQQLIRMSSRLRTICPSPRGLRRRPFDPARSARTAALQTIRDGLLSAADLATLLPTAGTEADRLTPGALLALVDDAALRTTPTATNRTHSSDNSDTTSPAIADEAREVAETAGSRTAGLEAQHANPTHQWSPAQRPSGRRTSRTVAGRPRTHAARAADNDDLLLRRTLHLDEQHKAEHGKPITRNELRAALNVSTDRASQLLRDARNTNTEEVA